MTLRHFRIEAHPGVGDTTVEIDGVNVTSGLMSFTLHQGGDLGDRIPTLQLEVGGEGVIEGEAVVLQTVDPGGWFDRVDAAELDRVVLETIRPDETFGSAALRILKGWATGGDEPKPDDIVTAEEYHARGDRHRS